MASDFGEVLLPVSRAFWDEDDENGSSVTDEDKTDLTVRWIKEKPVSIKWLIVVDDDLLVDFAKACLCPGTDEIAFVVNQNQQKISSFYHINSDVYLCTILSTLDKKLCMKFVDKISDLISIAESTICLTYQHMTKFQSKEAHSFPYLLRQLSTKNGVGVLKIKSLEQPNIISGVTAGVLSYAEFMGYPAIVYILYTDNFLLEQMSTEPLMQLFSAMNCTPHDVTFAGKSFFNSSNLYI